MPQYLVAVYNGPETRSRPAEEMTQTFADVEALNKKAIETGVFVFAGGLHDQSATTVIDPRGGSVEITDGPYQESKEYLGGFGSSRFPIWMPHWRGPATPRRPAARSSRVRPVHGGAAAGRLIACRS